MNSKIMEKINKLMALGSSPEKGEASTAMEMAIRLMEENNISYADLDASKLEDELIRVWNIKLTGRTDIVPDYGLAEPMIWVRDKERPDITRLITDFNAGSKSVALAGYWNTFEKLFDDYTFLDGSPCGMFAVEEE